MTSLQAIFGQKCQVFLILSKAHFLMEMHINNTKDVKQRGLQDGYLGFAIFKVFDPQISKKQSFPKKCPQNPKFFELSKNRNVCERATCHQPLCQISAGYLKI